MLRNTSALPNFSNPDTIPSPCLASTLLLGSSPSPIYVPMDDGYNSPLCAGLSGAAGHSLASDGLLALSFIGGTMTSQS